MDGNLKLILGLMWTLIQHYSMSLTSHLEKDRDEASAVADDEHAQAQRKSESKMSPKKQLLTWINQHIDDRQVHNFTSDWKDGKNLAALVSSLAPGDDLFRFLLLSVLMCLLRSNIEYFLDPETGPQCGVNVDPVYNFLCC